MKKSKKQSIYLMSYDNMYKIGISNNVENRYKTFLTGNPDIKLICYSKPISFAHKMEHKLHRILKNKNKSGEWFQLTESDIASIMKVIKNLTEDYKLELLATS